MIKCVKSIHFHTGLIMTFTRDEYFMKIVFCTRCCRCIALHLVTRLNKLQDQYSQRRHKLSIYWDGGLIEVVNHRYALGRQVIEETA